MATNILVKRGISGSFSTVVLKSGEPAFLTDLGKLYIGDGTKKVLINPMDKPTSIVTTNFYSKIKVNEYGQVVSQANLVASDIPTITNTQVSGLGSASTLNAGSAVGNVPVLDSSARLGEAIMPLSVIGSGIVAYYNGLSGTLVNTGQYVPLVSLSNSNATIYSIDSSGIITINQPGLYFITYSITSATLLLHTVLGAGNTNNWIGSFARSTTTAVTPYTCTSATIFKQIQTVPEKFGIKNLGPTDISLLSGYASLSIVKIG